MVRHEEARKFLLDYARSKGGRFTSSNIARLNRPTSWISVLGWEIGEMLEEGELIEVERTPVTALNYETYEAVYELKTSTS